MKVFQGQLVVLVQATDRPGKARLEVSSPGLENGPRKRADHPVKRATPPQQATPLVGAPVGAPASGVAA